MKKLVSISLLALLAPTVFGAEAPGHLFDALLPDLPPNQEVSIEEITLQPGHVGRAHRHDAFVYVYVVEGAVDMQVDNGEVVRVSTGEVFVETPENDHTMNNNASATERARFVAFIIKTAGVPVVLPVTSANP
jgi:quercetin dioxygenase-like cupin family protein